MVDFTCVMSALFFEASNITFIIFLVRLRQQGAFTQGSSKHGDLDPDDIRKQWDFRHEFHNIFLLAGILNALAWMCLALPLIQLAWVLSRRGTKYLGRHGGIAILAILSSMTEWMSRLLWWGASLTANFLTREFNLDHWKNFYGTGSADGIGWRMIEIKHVTDNGMILFVDAFEWICLSGIFMLIYLSVRDWQANMSATLGFSKCWNGLTLFLSLLTLLEFIVELLRFQGLFVFGSLAMAYAFVLRLVLIPIWILMLGCQMPRALALLTVSDSRARENSMPPPIRRGSSAVDSSIANSSSNGGGEVAMTQLQGSPDAAAGIGGEDNKPSSPDASAFAIGGDSDDDELFGAYDDLRIKQTQRKLADDSQGDF